MKAKLLLLVCLFMGSFMMSCDDDDNIKNVDNELQELFAQMYPDAKGVKWEMDKGYYVADFWLDGFESEAWFTKGYKWFMTEFDIPYALLPDAVKAAFESSEFATEWYIDDIDKFEFPDEETRYVIEIEKGERERKLIYNAAGQLL